jgi:L-threonylcarbamoyladenylate synthase
LKIVHPSPTNIALAAEAILAGDLVGMPTETVYGIAADATNEMAVRRVFEAKGRPADNPLIVHISYLDQIEGVARLFPESARRLAQRFWPGPLTIVVPKSRTLPSAVTAGLDTVAVRMPAHPVAQALIEASGRPLSAPSANLFTAMSPTRPDHIPVALAEKLAMILDGGPCEVGLESTVVDCSGEVCRLLRPGAVTRERLEAVLGQLTVGGESERRSPGTYPRHYAPRTPLHLVNRLGPGQPGLTFEPMENDRQVQMPLNAEAYAAGLYAALHHLDSLGLEAIYVQRPPASPDWEAIQDRLKKASALED